MSSILEALKKLEDEKAARRGGSGNLAGKVAKTGRRPRQSHPWLLPGGMLAVAVVSVLITYLAMNGFSFRHGESLPAQKPQQARLPDTPLPQAGAPVMDPLSARKPDVAPRKKSEGNAVPLSPAPRRNASPGPESSMKPEARPSPAPAKSRPDGPGAPLPTLNVSGIAWQNDKAYRLAVVNGVPVREGGTVEGSTVKEILSDRVRFSLNGKDFEVLMEQ